MRAPAIVGATGLITAAFLCGAGAASGAPAEGMALTTGSPGVDTGSVDQYPIRASLDDIGNTSNLVGFLNPTFGSRGLNS